MAVSMTVAVCLRGEGGAEALACGRFGGFRRFVRARDGAGAAAGGGRCVAGAPAGGRPGRFGVG